MQTQARRLPRLWCTNRQGRHDKQPNRGSARHKDEHTHEEEKQEKCMGRQGGGARGGAAHKNWGYNSRLNNTKASSSLELFFIYFLCDFRGYEVYPNVVSCYQRQEVGGIFIVGLVPRVTKSFSIELCSILKSKRACTKHHATNVCPVK